MFYEVKPGIVVFIIDLQSCMCKQMNTEHNVTCACTCFVLRDKRSSMPIIIRQKEKKTLQRKAKSYQS